MVRVVLSSGESDDDRLEASIDNNDGKTNYDDVVMSMDCADYAEAEEMVGTFNAEPADPDEPT